MAMINPARSTFTAYAALMLVVLYMCLPTHAFGANKDISAYEKKIMKQINKVASDTYLCHCNLPECESDGSICKTRNGCFTEISRNKLPIEPKLDSPDDVEDVVDDQSEATGCLELLTPVANCKDITGSAKYNQTEFPALKLPEGHEIQAFKCCNHYLCNRDGAMVPPTKYLLDLLIRMTERIEHTRPL